MRKSYPKYISKFREHSYARYDIRDRKDLYLHDDVEDYLSKNPAKLSGLVDMLLDNHFFHVRYTDPEYPM